MRAKSQQFLADTYGGIATLFAITFGLVAFTAGASIEYSRAVSLQATMQTVADSAALALMDPKLKTQSEIDFKLQQMVNVYQSQFDENFFRSVRPSAILSNDKKQVSVTMSGSMDFIFLNPLLGPLKIKVNATTERGLQNELEVALVLDTTFSMTASGKIGALKTAANMLVDILTEDPEAKVRFALVPFAQYVRLDLSLRDSSWLTRSDDYEVRTPRPPRCTRPQTTCADLRTRDRCVNTNCRPRIIISDGVEIISGTTCDRVCGGPYGTETYCARWNYGEEVCTPQSDSVQRYTWHGCVASRAAPFDTTDDNSTIPYPAMYNNNTCSTKIAALTSDKAAIKNAISGLTPSGETYTPAGLIWGLNVLSPNLPFGEGAAYDPNGQKPRKVVIFLTDGENTKSPAGATGTTPQGVLHNGNNRTQADQKAAAICTNIKDKGIEIFSIGLMIDDAAALRELKSCASSSQHYFDASDVAYLQKAFEEIALSLQKPRLVK